jgi:GT2 family glycosyltransferase
MLQSLSEQSRLPAKVVVVASGTRASEEVVSEFQNISIVCLHVAPGSIASARNVGLRAVKDDADLVAFVDDDVVFQPGSVESMLRFWEQASEEVGGAGFNFQNKLAPETARKWALAPVKKLYGLFLGEKQSGGRVLASGFPTPIYPVGENARVQWLETIAVVFRREVAERFQFDEFFAGYSYLEFLDFTYTISKQCKLYVVSDAWVTHHSSPIKNSYLLGKKQVVNRIYFVRKHRELSLPRCLGALSLHTGFNLALGLILRDGGHLKRALGNAVGFTEAALGRLDPVPGSVK